MKARTYVVGLPVIVTVHDDGRVEYDVDTAETSVAIFDTEANDPGYPIEVIIVDAGIIDHDHDRRIAAENPITDEPGKIWKVTGPGSMSDPHRDPKHLNPEQEEET